MTDILKTGVGILEVLDVMSGCMRAGSDPDRREGRPSDCFVYALCGSAEYIFPTMKLAVAEGSVLYLPKGSVYQIRVLEEYRHIFIDFRFAREKLLPAAVRDMQALEAVFRRALKRWLKGSDSSALCCMGCLYEIYGELMERSRAGYISDESRKTARKAAEYMLDRLADQELRMTEIAGKAGVSTAHLRRIFHAAFGVAPNSYLQQKRIQRAKMLLMETELSLEEIAEATGFCNACYFSRVFRNLSGMSPGMYRQENGRR